MSLLTYILMPRKSQHMTRLGVGSCRNKEKVVPRGKLVSTGTRVMKCRSLIDLIYIKLLISAGKSLNLEGGCSSPPNSYIPTYLGLWGAESLGSFIPC